MTIVGVIAEYNPFHNGHLYQINKIKEELNPDYIIVALGNNFSQRGEPTLLDKFARTKLALKYGVDCVIEMPTIFTCASAEYFANCGVKLLDSLGIVTHLCFGAENDSYTLLDGVATILVNEDKPFKKLLKDQLNLGLSFPSARANAIIEYLNIYIETNILSNASELKNILSSSNNILAIEYLKALKRINSNIKPYIIKRNGPDYHSLDVKGTFSSATNIREKLYDDINNISSIKDVMPKGTFESISSISSINSLSNSKNHIQCSNVINQDSFSDIFHYRINQCSSRDLSSIKDIREGIQNTLLNESKTNRNISEIIKNSKSKRFTSTTLSRIITNIILDITNDDFEFAAKGFPNYIRILGFRNDSKDILKIIKDSLNNINKNKKEKKKWKINKTELIINFNQFYKECKNKKIKKLLDKEMLYNNIYHIKSDGKVNLDLTTKVICYSKDNN